MSHDFKEDPVHFSRSSSVGACVATLVAALVALGPGPARAQGAPGTWSGDLHAGVVLPGGGLSKVTSAGPTVGGGIMYRFLPNFGVRTDLTADLMDGNQDSQGNQFPSLKLLHIMAGLELDAPRPDWQDHPLTTALRVGVGLTHMATNHSEVAGPLSTFSHTYFTVMSGVRLGWQFNQYLNVFASGDAYLALGKRAASLPYTQASPEVGLFRNYWTFPLSIGAQVTIP